MAKVVQLAPREIMRFLLAGNCLIAVIGLAAFQNAGAQPGTQAASQKKIEILSFGRMGRDAAFNPDLTIFRNNVKIRHNDAIMYCDSAYHNEKQNQVTAFGRIRIEQGDTLTLKGNYLFYDGNTEKAFVSGQVELKDKETVLTTDVINYDLKNRVAYYDTQGTIINGDDELISNKGVYYASDKMFHFSQRIRIKGPDYLISADTMNYHTVNEIVIFTGPTSITGDSIRIFARSGWYDTKNKISRIWNEAMVDNLRQQIEGDTLYYDENKGSGFAFGNILIADTANNSVVKGNYAQYAKSPEEFTVTEQAVYIMYGKNDTLYMHADTLRGVTIVNNADTSLNYRLVRAWYGNRIYSHDFQSRTDSLSYSFKDSTIRMYGNPILWSEENQLTADSIVMFTRNERMERMELYGGAFVISQVDSARFNQIKGRTLTGFFADNKLGRVLVAGNGESVYFLIEDEELVGVNYSKSSNIEIVLQDGKISEVTEFGNPDGVLDPPALKKPEEMKLDGFRWLKLIRPVDRNDIFRQDIIKNPG